MKKPIACLLLCLLLGLCLPLSAAAETSVLVNLGSVRAGDYLDLMLGASESGSVELTDGALPDNCYLVSEEQNDAVRHYLRGTPRAAGVCSFSLAVTDGGQTLTALDCSLTVLPAVPSIGVYNLNCLVGEEAVLTVSASVTDGGSLSYRWYQNEFSVNAGGSLISGQSGDSLAVNTETPGAYYYYCEVTNTNHELSETVTSGVITVSVQEPEVSDISVYTLPDKRNYRQGETLDPAGLSILVSYVNGSTAVLDSGFILMPETMEHSGTQTVTVLYGDRSCGFLVTVEEAESDVSSIIVSALPTRLNYSLGDTLDSSGLILTVITDAGSYTVNSGFTLTPTTLDTAGTQTITVSYLEHSTSFTVNVSDPDQAITRLTIFQLPNRLSYTVGESLDTTGLVLTAISDQGEMLVTVGYSCQPSKFSKTGTQNVVVTYEGKSCEFSVEVSAAQKEPSQKPRVTPAADEDGTEPGATAAQQPASRRSWSDTQKLERRIIAALAVSLLIACGLVSYLVLTHKKARDYDEDEW